MASKTWTVYVGQDPINLKLYVGMTSMALNTRVNSHRAASKGSRHALPVYQHTREHGFELMQFSSVSEHSEKSLAYKYEEDLTIILRAMLGNDCVLNRVNGPGTGRVITEDTRKKLAVSRNGEKSPHYDHTLYDFYHMDHGDVRCTKYQLRIKYSLSDSHVSQVCSGKREHVGGWRVRGSSWKHAKPSKVYTFVHPVHGEVTCTQAELSRGYNVEDSSISSMVRGRRPTAGGWKLKSPG